MNRRSCLVAAAAPLALTRTATVLQERPAPSALRKGRLKQGVTRGVFGRGVSLDDCCRRAASLGIQGFDLMTPEDWATVKKYGLVPSMASGAGGTIPVALNRIENHARIEASMREMIDKAAANGL